MKFATLLTVVLEELSFKKLFFFLNLMLPWQPKKLSLDIKHINWVDNHPVVITANLVHITLMVMEKMQFNP